MDFMTFQEASEFAKSEVTKRRTDMELLRLDDLWIVFGIRKSGFEDDVMEYDFVSDQNR